MTSAFIAIYKLKQTNMTEKQLTTYTFLIFFMTRSVERILV